MLACEQCGKYLEVFLDQALGVKETLDIQEHIQTCARCASHVEAERMARVFVRNRAVATSLSEEVKQRIVRTAMQPQRPFPWWRNVQHAVRLRDVAIGMAVAAAVLLVVSGPLATWWQESDMTQQFARETSMAYQAYSDQQIPLDVVSADDKLVAKWFNTRMGYTLPVPCITDKATQLLGGRLCRLLNRKSATLKYQRNGVDIFLFAFKGDQLPPPTKHAVRTGAGTFYVQQIAGRPVAVWQRGDITYSMVGDVDQAALLQVAGTVSYR